MSCLTLLGTKANWFELAYSMSRYINTSFSDLPKNMEKTTKFRINKIENLSKIKVKRKLFVDASSSFQIKIHVLPGFLL